MQTAAVTPAALRLPHLFCRFINIKYKLPINDFTTTELLLPSFLPEPLHSLCQSSSSNTEAQTIISWFKVQSAPDVCAAEREEARVSPFDLLGDSPASASAARLLRCRAADVNVPELVRSVEPSSL